MNDPLFPLPDATESLVARVTAAARVQRPNRTPRQWRPSDLEALRPPAHRARVVWDVVEGLDLSPL